MKTDAIRSFLAPQLVCDVKRQNVFASANTGYTKSRIAMLVLCAVALSISGGLARAELLVYQQSSQPNPFNQFYGGSNAVHLTNVLDQAFDGDVAIVSDFSDTERLRNADAVWVEQHYTNTIPAADRDALFSFLSSGRHIVMVGENPSLNIWNGQILSLVGGFSDGQAPSGVAVTPIISHAITEGVSSVLYGGSGAGIARGGAQVGTQVFSDYNTVTLWGETQNALTLLDTHLVCCGELDIPQFRENVAQWLADSPDPSAFINVKPWSTHLKVLDDQDIDYDEDEFGLRLDAEIIDLANDLSFAVQPGDYLRLQRFGEFDFALSGDTGGPNDDGALRNLWGVFSSSDTLLAKTEDNRVPDAVELLTGNAPDLITPAANDISFDFVIDELGDLLDPEGVLVRVPEGATHLFVSAGDTIWFDNRVRDGGSFGLQITLLDSTQFAGDSNLDGKIDGVDYIAWAQHYGDDPAADPPGSPANGDFNDDGVVDGIDYIIWASNYGQGPNDGVAVPEPTAMCIALFSLATLLTTSQRRCRLA